MTGVPQREYDARPRVLIRTLPLRNANYGGTLQAYALGQVMATLGADAFVDVSLKRDAAPQAVKAARTLASAVVRRRYTPSRVARTKDNKEFYSWAARYIRQTAFFEDQGANRRPYDAVIVGSDQVWRADYNYGEIAEFFLASDEFRSYSTRMSYAASFGADEPSGYSDTDVRSGVEGLRQFAGLSVREEAGADIVQSWGLPRPEVHVDPTMLLGREHWGALAGPPPSAERYVFSYVLDGSPSKLRVSTDAAESLGVRLRELDYAEPVNYRDAFFRRRSRPSPQVWLSLVKNAEAIVTDSFHGCVFAILFGKPFVALVNQERGASRFNTLLGKFCLEDRVLKEGSSVRELVRTPTRQDAIDRVLDVERRRAFDYLRAAVSGPSNSI